MQRVNLERNKFHGEWNYVIKPERESSMIQLLPLFINGS